MDENFQTYLNRAMRTILPDTYRTQVQNIQESPKFKPDGTGGLTAQPFPGYTVITPPGQEDDEDNHPLFASLEHLQKHLTDALGTEMFVALPPSSFHLTVADMIWAHAFEHASADAKFEPQLRDLMGRIFQECAPLQQGPQISLRVLGLMVMPRAIAACLVPTDEPSYDRLLKFRRTIYQNRELMGLGIEQQYYFTPHITLGYFGNVTHLPDRASAADAIIDLNHQWLDQDPQFFTVTRAELRKFDDMTRYYREPDWAMFQF